MNFNLKTVDSKRSTPAWRVLTWGGIPVGLLLGLATVAGAYDSSWIAPGQPVSSSKLKQALDETNAQIGTLAAAQTVRVVKSSDQLFGSGGASVVFDAVKLNGVPGWNYDTFVTQTGGVYRIVAKLGLPSAPGTGTRYLNLLVNGNLYAQVNSQPAMETATQAYLMDVVRLAAGDTVNIQVASDGGTFKVAGLADGRGSTLTIERLGN